MPKAQAETLPYLVAPSSKMTSVHPASAPRDGSSSPSSSASEGEEGVAGGPKEEAAGVKGDEAPPPISFFKLFR